MLIFLAVDTMQRALQHRIIFNRIELRWNKKVTLDYFEVSKSESIHVTRVITVYELIKSTAYYRLLIIKRLQENYKIFSSMNILHCS